MNKSTALRRILLAPPSVRTTLIIQRTYLPALALPRGYSTIPSITSRSFWASLIPKPFRKSSTPGIKSKKLKSKEWNPATFFIIIFLLIGSMSIQMIALKNKFAAFTRRADAKIGLLKEIIGRIQNGEEVDVEGLLGTGDAKREKEWEEVLKEIEEEDQAWESSRRSKPKHGKNLGESKASSEGIEKAVDGKPKATVPPGFY